MDEDKKNKRGKREGEQEAVMNYSLSFMEELEREEEVQQQLMKENEKNSWRSSRKILKRGGRQTRR